MFCFKLLRESHVLPPFTEGNGSERGPYEQLEAELPLRGSSVAAVRSESGCLGGEPK